jgi:hypothetical protein
MQLGHSGRTTPPCFIALLLALAICEPAFAAAGPAAKAGSQIELRLRFQPLPGNLMLEAGYAHLFAGEFIEKAPNATHRGDSNYVYTQATLKF